MICFVWVLRGYILATFDQIVVAKLEKITIAITILLNFFGHLMSWDTKEFLVKIGLLICAIGHCTFLNALL